MRVVVTGANRGLGAEVARRLAADVIGTSREAGARHRLDLADPDSIRAFADRIDLLDVLVDNAATAMTGFDERVARETLATNLVGTIALTEALLPKLRQGGRIVLVSSGMGELGRFSGQARRALEDPEQDGTTLLAQGDRFVREVAAGTHEASGWPSSAYGTSKALLNAYARHLARRLAGDPRGLRVLAVCPGWVRTRMGGESAPRSVEQGATGIVWAATAPEVPASGFFRDARPIPW